MKTKILLAETTNAPRGRLSCYSASSERKLLLHKLMCIVLSAVVIALCRAIRMVCLHDVSMIAIGVEGADQGEEEPSHHHVAPGMSLPHEPSHFAATKGCPEADGPRSVQCKTTD
jgi:hypothetical protein